MLPFGVVSRDFHLGLDYAFNLPLHLEKRSCSLFNRQAAKPRSEIFLCKFHLVNAGVLAC